MTSDLKSRLRRIFLWADEQATKADLGGPNYSVSEPYWNVKRAADDALDMISYLEGKVDGFRLAQSHLRDTPETPNKGASL